MIANPPTPGPPPPALLPGPTRHSYAKVIVEVHDGLDGSLTVFSQGARVPSRPLTTSSIGDRIPARHPPRVHANPVAGGAPHRTGGILIAAPSRKTHPGASERTSSPPPPRNSSQPRKPPVDHPWRQRIRNEVKMQAVRKAG